VDSSIDAAKGSIVAYGRAQGKPDEMIQNDLLSAESKARMAVMTRMADTDPKSAIDYYHNNQTKLTGEDLIRAQALIVPTERKYKAMNVASNVLAEGAPKVSDGDVINYVMNNLEGGDQVITDGNGAIAKFGINAKANPDVDVANLDAQTAQQIYMQRYWNKIDGDKLPPDMRLAAMSFAVTSGTGPANDLIDKAGNDPRKFQELASGYYQNLATQNPDKYGKSLPGWMNRVANVSAQIDAMHGQLPSEVDMFDRINAQTSDPQVASDAKELVSKQIEAMKKDQTDKFSAASQDAWRYRQSGQEVPPSVVARMNPKDVEDMQKSASPDPAVYEDARQHILAGQHIDLKSIRWQLGSKFDDLVELQGDPVKAQQNSVLDNSIKQALPAILNGHSSVKTDGDYQTVAQFRGAVMTQLQAVQKQTGKMASPQETQAVVDKMLLSTSAGMLGKPLFQLAPGQQAKVAGIPATGTHLIKGTPYSQAQVLDIITKNLTSRNIPITTENVRSTYKKLTESGQIQYTYDQR
jgi:lysozyme family protein